MAESHGSEILRHIVYRGIRMPVIRADVDFGMDEKENMMIIGHKMEIMVEKKNYGYLRDGRPVKYVGGSWECLV